jgi:nitrous oxidase accessory protein
VIYNSNTGIYLINSDSNTLVGNLVENNTQDGVVLTSANNNIIAGNTIRGNTRIGLFLDYYWIADYAQTYYHCSKNNIVTENVIMNNDNGVLMVRASGNKLINNSMEYNVKYSIQLANSSGNVIHGNGLSGCIARDSSSTDNDIFPEVCFENVEYIEDEGSTWPFFYGYVAFICMAIAGACILCAVVVFRKKHRQKMILPRMI